MQKHTIEESRHTIEESMTTDSLDPKQDLVLAQQSGYANGFKTRCYHKVLRHLQIPAKSNSKAKNISRTCARFAIRTRHSLTPSHTSLLFRPLSPHFLSLIHNSENEVSMNLQEQEGAHTG